MDMKKIVLACAAVSLLCGGDAFAAKKAKGNHQKAPSFNESLANSEANDKKPDKKMSKNQKKNFNKSVKIKTVALLQKMKFEELNEFPADFLSGGEEGTFEDVGIKFGKHVQKVWNLSSDSTANSKPISNLFKDLTNTATAISLNGQEVSEDAADAGYDFSGLDEMDFQGIIAKYDGTKAFYLNALAKIAHTLQQGTDGHVFWHGMFKIFVSLLVAYHYIPYLKTKVQ